MSSIEGSARIAMPIRYPHSTHFATDRNQTKKVAIAYLASISCDCFSSVRAKRLLDNVFLAKLCLENGNVRALDTPLALDIRTSDYYAKDAKSANIPLIKEGRLVDPLRF